MTENQVRERVLVLSMQYKSEQRALLDKARSIEDQYDDDKDTLYRQAAVLGIRLASLDKVLKDINVANPSDLKCTRAIQRHNRDMLRLKYKPRNPNVDFDGLDNEVLSQFNNVGIVINDKPYRYKKDVSFTDVKIK